MSTMSIKVFTDDDEILITNYISNIFKQVLPIHECVNNIYMVNCDNIANDTYNIFEIANIIRSDVETFNIFISTFISIPVTWHFSLFLACSIVASNPGIPCCIFSRDITI